MGKTFQRLMGVAASVALLVAAGAAEAQTQKKKPAPAPASKAAVPAPSAAKRGIGKGDTEIGVFGVLSSFDDQDLDLLTVGATFGKFLSDSFELRVSPVITVGNVSGGTIFTLAPVVSGEFVFRAGPQVAPFVGGGIQLQVLYLEQPTLGDTFGLGLGLGPTGGVKFFLAERMALELALTYTFGFIELYDEVSISNSGDYNELRQDLRFNFYY